MRPNLTRDLAILYTVGLCKVLPSREIRRLFFRSQATCADRLRKLFCAGLLDCHVRNLHEPNFYALTERGRAYVCDHADVEPSDLAVARALPAQLDHLVATNEVRVHLTLATRSNPEVELVFFRPSWELQAERQAGIVGLVPDALVGLEDSRVLTVVALEVDLGSEAPVIVRRKVVRYSRLTAAGLPFYGHEHVLPVVLASGTRRLRQLAVALAEAGVRDGVLLGDLETLDEHAVLGPAFTLPRDIGDEAAGHDLRVSLTGTILHER